MKGQRAKGRGLRVAKGLGLAALLTLLVCSASTAETIDRVLAVAGGQVIMLSDVTAALDFGLVTNDASTDRIGAGLAKLIDRSLVLVEANRYAPPEPDDQAVERELVAVRGRFQSVAAYEAALQRSGLTEAQLRVTVRENLRIRAYIAQRFTGAENEDRRQMLIDEWLAGLRLRSDVIDLYATAR